MSDQNRRRILVKATDEPHTSETKKSATWKRLLTPRYIASFFYALAVLVALTGIGMFAFDNSESAVPVKAHLVPPPKAVSKTSVTTAVTLPQELSDSPVKMMPEADVTPKLLPAWRRYAAKAPNLKTGPHITIVVDDMGIDVPNSRRAIRLDARVTLAFLPYARHVKQLTDEARAKGHELLVHLPMEPTSHNQNPGPHALLTELPVPELIHRLDWNLSRFSGYVGVNNHMGSVFTANRSDMVPILSELKNRGLLFLDSRTTDATVGRGTAEKLHLPFAERDVFLDNVRTAEAVRKQLDKVEEIARKYGTAIAIGHPHPVTLQGLEAWLPELHNKGLILVPLSGIVSENMEKTRLAQHQDKNVMDR